MFKVTIKTPERRHWHHSGAFIVNFEHILHLVLVFIINFEQANADWEETWTKQKQICLLISLVNNVAQ